MKKVIGKNDIEDALKTLDRLTQEARMAAAQLPVHSRAAGKRPRAVRRCRAASVRSCGAGVDDWDARVDDRVKDVDEKVRAVGNKLVEVIDGARYIFNRLL